MLTGALIVLALVVVGGAITLGVIFGGSAKPPKPDPPQPPVINPYQISEAKTTEFGTQVYTLKRDTSLKNIKEGIAVTENNQYKDTVQLQAALNDYSSLRLSIGDPAHDYQVSPKYLDPKVGKASSQGIKFGMIGFSVGVPSSKLLGDSKSAFAIKIFDKKTDEVYVTTQDQNFLMMSHYMEVGMRVSSQKMMGLGERQRKLLLKEGIYTLTPFNGDYQYDLGYGHKQGYGQHPFLMLQLNNNNFMGIFLLNSNAQQIEIKKVFNSSDSIINFKAIGGMMDFHFFIGPKFDDVVKQYHSIIGKPKMLPLWAHGFFSKSTAYSDQNQLEKAITGFTTAGFPLQGMGLPIETLQGYYNLKYADLVTSIRKLHPAIQLILPFTHMVPEDTDAQLLKSFLNNTEGQSFAVQALKENLLNQIADKKGFCMDVFNPKFSEEYLQPLLQSQDTLLSGFWLDQNFPYADSTNATDNQANNPYFELPFVPGGSISEKTIPEFAQFRIDKDQQQDNFNMHGLFGNEMARQFMQSLPDNKQERNFVIADSTFPGIGQYRIAHIFPKQQATYNDLEVQLANLINFGMFGIPNVGPNLCGYKMQISDQELCARYFQLGVISPLAFLNNDEQTVDHLPFNFDKTYKDSILASLNQRFKFMSYMRTQLYLISQLGGSLVKPVFGMFPDMDAESSDKVMFGSHIKVDFQFMQDNFEKNVYLPAGKWIDLNTFEVHQSIAGKNVFMKSGLDQVNMFQHGRSTVIAFQDTTTHKVSKIEDLRNVPLTLSIALDGIIGTGSAIGYVMVEAGSVDLAMSELYEVKVVDQVIQFKQQNSGSAYEVGSTQIEKIIISFVSTMQTACAIKSDLTTVQQLYVASYNETRKQAVIQPNDPKNPEDKSQLVINDLAYILYGDSEQSCDQSLFQMKVVEKIQDDQFTTIVKVTQKINAIHQGWSPDLYLNVTLLTDNSVYIKLGTSKSEEETGSGEVYDTSFANFKHLKVASSLKDILVLNEDPFYFEIKNSTNKDEVIFTTKDQLTYMNLDMNIFNFAQPSQNSERFFGLGERKGKFFLQDKYTYSLYSNNNNLDFAIQANERVVEYGKNGYFPIIYSQHATNFNLHSITVYTANGLEVSFNKGTQQNRISLLTGRTDIKLVFTFGLSHFRAVDNVHLHIQFGKLLKNYNIKLPPQESFFGLQMLVKNQDDLITLMHAYDYDCDWPLDGLVLDLDSLDRFQSLTLNQTRFTQETIDYIKARGIAVWQISKSGVSTEIDSKLYQQLLDDQLVLTDKRVPGEPATAYDPSGEVVYLDYTQEKTCEVIDYLIESYTQKYPLLSDKIGIQLKNNEISKYYCKSGSCMEEVNDQQNTQWMGKPGTLEQTSNTFGWIWRDQGWKREDDYHNLNGIIEQISYANKYGTKYPLLSDSNTIGSGRLGVASRNMDFFELQAKDIESAVQTLQTQSLMGMSMLGAQFQITDQVLAYTDKDDLFNLTSRAILLNAFSSLAIQNFYPALKSMDYLRELRNIQLFKYMMLKYTRSQVFAQSNFGSPLIRPLFFDQPTDLQAYNMINTQYMYGPSFMYAIDIYKSDLYYTQGTWCSLSYQDTHCYWSEKGQQLASSMIDGKIYLKEGTITPLQNVYSIPMVSAYDLQVLKTDLHVLAVGKQTPYQGYGELLVHRSGEDYCWIQMNWSGKTITFVDKSKEMGGSGKCGEVEGFYLGDLIVYDFKNMSIKSAKINGFVDMVLKVQENDQIGIFQLDKVDIHISTITNIEFA